MRQEESHVYLRKRAFVLISVVDTGTVGSRQICRQSWNEEIVPKGP
jgi:hypothetical protein